MIDADVSIFLEDIIDRSMRAASYVEGMSLDQFLADTRTQEAVALNLILIGEAVKNLAKGAPSLLALKPDVPWRNIASMRDRIAHSYSSLNLVVVYGTAKADLDPLASAAQDLLAHTSRDEA